MRLFIPAASCASEVAGKPLRSWNDFSAACRRFSHGRLKGKVSIYIAEVIILPLCFPYDVAEL